MLLEGMLCNWLCCKHSGPLTLRSAAFVSYLSVNIVGIKVLCLCAVRLKIQDLISILY